MRRTVWTIGHSNRSLADFLDLLKLHGIELLVDVRRWPTSKKFPYFAFQALKPELRRVGIQAIWLGDLLGGFRKDGYEAHMTTADFRRGLELLEQRAAFHRTAFMCAELLYFRCHRRFIADALVRRGWHVVHIVDARRTIVHRERLAEDGQLALDLQTPPV